MKLYHFLIVLVVIGVLATFMSNYLSGLKTYYSDAGLDTSHMNVSVYDDFSSDTAVGDYISDLENSSEESAISGSQDLDVGLFKRFGVISQIKDVFHNFKSLFGTAARELRIPSYVIFGFLTIISIVILVKLALGWILDR